MTPHLETANGSDAAPSPLSGPATAVAPVARWRPGLGLAGV